MRIKVSHFRKEWISLDFYLPNKNFPKGWYVMKLHVKIPLSILAWKIFFKNPAAFFVLWEAMPKGEE